VQRYSNAVNFRVRKVLTVKEKKMIFYRHLHRAVRSENGLFGKFDFFWCVRCWATAGYRENQLHKNSYFCKSLAINDLRRTARLSR
jgi:hypothetical protein